MRRMLSQVWGGAADRRGMTLIEIMIVLLILGSIAALLGVNVAGEMKKAKKRQAVILINSLSQALSSYYTDCGSYPSTEEGLQALVERTASCDSWGPEPYLEKNVPKDPWKMDFIYEQDGSRFVLISLGADKREGGEGFDADISSEDDNI